MKGIVNYIKRVLDANSSDSSKRFFALLLIVALIVVTFLNQCLKLAIDPVIVNALLTAFGFCVGAIGAENITNAIKEMRKRGINIPDDIGPSNGEQNNK